VADGLKLGIARAKNYYFDFKEEEFVKLSGI